MNIKRFIQHLFLADWPANRAFSQSTLNAIYAAINTSEKSHSGEIRFVIESSLGFHALVKGVSARERAIDIFSQLRIWDTEQNNGLLIYMLFADRAVEIIADRGINAKVDGSEWEKICRLMEVDFKLGKYLDGALKGVQETTAQLIKHYPCTTENNNELPDTPILL